MHRLFINPVAASIVFTAALPADEVSEPLHDGLRTWCTQCHGDNDTVEGGVNLLKLYQLEPSPRAQLLQKLIRVLRDQEMPPEGADPLPADIRSQVIHTLQDEHTRMAEGLPFIPIPARRMNRFQYNNAVVDLLELDRQLFQMNELLMRRRSDYFHPASGKMPDEVRVSTRPLSKDIDNQRPEGFRGVSAFPQDQRAEHGFDNRADHLSLSPLLMESFLKLSRSITQSPDLNPQECRSWDRVFAPPGQPVRGARNGRFEADNPAHMLITGLPLDLPRPQNLKQYGKHWSNDSHLFWRCSAPGQRFQLSFDVQRPANGLRIQFTTASDYGRFEVLLDDKTILPSVDLYHPTVFVQSQSVADVPIPAGKHTLTFRCTGKNEVSKRHYFGVDHVDLIGQSTTDEDSPIPSTEDAVRTRLQFLLRRAFRRPIDQETIDRFAAFALQQLAEGKTLEQTMRSMVGAILALPEFLYLYEEPADSDVTEARTSVNDFELATRLSQFFWSSIPDDELLDLAADNTLHQPTILSRQIDRLLNDTRSSRFCDNFPGQWLQLDRLITAIPDQKLYPWFYYQGYRSSLHMMSEPLLLFETVYIENRSVMDLLNPDFTWESRMLKANYEGRRDADTEVQVQIFRRVPLTNPRRGGVITNSAVMTMTSTPTRTQPITRGAWINTVIFNDPPEPPPADVPALPEKDDAALEELTIRERLAEHRKRADCAGCHKRIDPLGFALENYGPTGVWRDHYENGREIDVAGTLFNRHNFSSAVEFRQLLVQEKDRFLRGFVSHLLSYALGREIGPADSPAIEQIVATAGNRHDQLRTIMKAVAMSAPFLHK